MGLNLGKLLSSKTKEKMKVIDDKWPVLLEDEKGEVLELFEFEVEEMEVETL